MLHWLVRGLEDRARLAGSLDLLLPSRHGAYNSNNHLTGEKTGRGAKLGFLGKPGFRSLRDLWWRPHTRRTTSGWTML